LLDDGKLIFEIVSTDKKTEVVAKVIQGGELKSKKELNLQYKISLPAYEKISPTLYLPSDKKEVDYLSFKNTQDLKDLQDPSAQHSRSIIAKSEILETLENMDKIVAYCDGLMVARGELRLPA
jgi:pyruvate kinase